MNVCITKYCKIKSNWMLYIISALLIILKKFSWSLKTVKNGEPIKNDVIHKHSMNKKTFLEILY